MNSYQHRTYRQAHTHGTTAEYTTGILLTAPEGLEIVAVRQAAIVTGEVIGAGVTVPVEY